MSLVLPADYRTRTVLRLVASAERSVIGQRTHVATLRGELAEAERALGAEERDLAEARGLAAELGVSLDHLDIGPGTVREMFRGNPIPAAHQPAS